MDDTRHGCEYAFISSGDYADLTLTQYTKYNL